MDETTDEDPGAAKDPAQGRGGPDPIPWRHVVVLVVTAMVAALLATEGRQLPPGDALNVGDIAPRTVKAPFSFTFQDLQTWEAARSAAGESAQEVWTLDAAVPGERASKIAEAFEWGRRLLEGRDPLELTDQERLAIAEEVVDKAGLEPLSGEDLEPLVATGFRARVEARALAWMAQVYERDGWVVAADSPVGSSSGEILIRDGQGEARERARSAQLKTVDEVRSEMTLESLQERRPEPWSRAVLAMSRELVAPNLVFDQAGTERARVAAEVGVEPDPVRVQRGETLFREGDPLSHRDVAKYRALQNSRSDHGVALGLLSRFGMNVLALLLLYGAGNTLRMQRFGENPDRVILAWAGTLVLSLALLRLVVEIGPGVADLVGNDVQATEVWLAAPLLGGVLLVAELMGVRRALSFVLAAVVPIGLIVGMHAPLVVWWVVTGVAAVALSMSMRERMDVLRTGLQVGAMGGALMVLLHFVQLYGVDGELSLATTIRPLWALLFALVGGVLSGFFVLGLVPLFERFGFVTDHRMMELASLNHPLMRQLMLRAPGTYHHSVVVGTLAEAACDRIGANGIQAKIAAYFHDIGKVDKPTYFVENQGAGGNRHGDLDPTQSADIIIDHVRRGARMAQEHRLPQPIIDNIRMHHGTGLLQFFFAKAQMQADDPAQVDESRFRYPGPLPNTREAGVIMLADKVEAATRSIKQPTEDNVRAMIQRIVNSVMADGQFAECPLTFREIHAVADVFVSVLMGIHHQRVEYPQTRGISSGEPRTQAPRAAIGQGAPGTITLELEATKGTPVAAWRDQPDDTTDYEAIRNLPQGRG